MNFDVFLSKLGARDRLNIERHLAICAAEPDSHHAKLWQRLIAHVAELAPLPAQTIGQQAVLFFIADGKYKMQVFAVEDGRDGNVQLYLPDVLDQAIRARVLGRAKEDGEGVVTYPIASDKQHTLRIDAMDARNTPNPPNHFKNMLGWNRKALRVTLPNNAGATQIEAAEALCELAAQKWAKAALQT